MPCDYSKYPANWKSEIRPAILKREGHCCKFCGVPNKAWVCRGTWGDTVVWQNDDGQIFDAANGKYLGSAYVGDVWTSDNPKKQVLTKVVLTIMHLDHDITNNDYNNLAAGCQRCHLNYDKAHHKKTAQETRNKKKKLQKLF
jgi:hypothetical protein